MHTETPLSSIFFIHIDVPDKISNFMNITGAGKKVMIRLFLSTIDTLIKIDQTNNYLPFG